MSLIPDLLSIKAKLAALGAAFAIGVTSAGVAAVYVHNWRVDNLEAAWTKKRAAAVETAKAETQLVCDKNNTITKEKARVLQTRLNGIADMYVGLLGQAGNCAHLATPAGAAAGGHGSAGADLPSVQVPLVDGLAAGKLNDDQAAKFMTLQDTVAEIYKAAGQAELLPEEYR